MILIADSGSTKTHWNVLDQGRVIGEIFTKGMNPFFQTPEEIRHEIERTLLPQLNSNRFCEVDAAVGEARGRGVDPHIILKHLMILLY